MKQSRLAPEDDDSADVLSLVEPEPFDPAADLSGAMDLLRVARAALKGRADSDADTRDAIERTIGHALETLGPVYSFLLMGNGGHEFDRRRQS